MGKSYPVKLIAYTKDPGASIKAVPLGSPYDIERYDKWLYKLYEIEGSNISRRDNGNRRLHPNSNEYKDIMEKAANF